MSNADAVRVPKTAELVARRIRNAIIRGELKDGDTLPAEAHLIAEFEVSRPTIREAVRILESEELVTVSRGARGGARISSPNYEMIARAAGVTLQAKGVTIGDLYEMRTLIEPPAARLVAERNAIEAVPVLRAQLDEQASVISDRPALVQAIAKFHRLMVELAGNETLTMLWRALDGLVAQHHLLAQRREVETDPKVLERRVRFGMRSQHKLVDLIAAGDGAGAEAHWRAHMKAAAEVWLDQVGRATVFDLLG